MTMAYIAVAFIVVAGAVEADTQKKAGKANAQIAENNARLADESAKDVAVQGARESQQSAWRSRAIVGAQRAGIAASGLDSELGTPFDLQTDAALFGGADQSAISMNAARKAWGFQSEALNYRNSGAQQKWMGKQQANITLLRTASSAMSMGADSFIGGGSKAGSQMAGGGTASQNVSGYGGIYG